MLPSSRAALARLVALVLAMPACAGGSGLAASIAKPPEWKPEGQTKCGVEKSQAHPLIVEWPSPDRGALEAQAKRGLVAVRYVGCEMELLRQCTLPGSYAYTPVTRKADHIAIKNADELYASIPIHAAQFESKLKASGELDVNTIIVGSYDADRTAVGLDELKGNCGGATHFISAITTGAFEFSAGAAAAIGAGAGVGSLGAHGESTADNEVLNRDGFKTACEQSTNSDKSPPDGCGALLRVEVSPLGKSTVAPPVVATSPNSPNSPTTAPSSFLVVVGPAPNPLEIEPPPPPSTARTVGNIGITAGTLGILVGLTGGLIALMEETNLSSGNCRNNVCPPSENGTLSAYHAMTTMADIGLIGGGALLAGGIVARIIAPGAPKKKPASSLRFNGTGVAGSF